MLYSILSPIIITTSKFSAKFLKDNLQVYQTLSISMFNSSAVFSKLQLTASKTDEKQRILQNTPVPEKKTTAPT